MERKVKNNLIVLNHEIKRLTDLLDAELRDIESKLLAKRNSPRVVRKQIDGWFEMVDLYDRRIERLERQASLLEAILQENEDV